MTIPHSTGFAVAVDGPGGVGKSTAARRVAKRLNMTYIDTGAMYRAVALYNIRQGTDPQNETAIVASLLHINITLDKQQILLNGEDVTKSIRTQEISEYTSVISPYAPVRKKLIAVQQKFAASGEVVMDGRDIGSQVLPWAQVKIYLDADVSIRAQRRASELAAKGQPADITKILEEIKTRDHRDKTRDNSPLIRTDDAIYIDTGHMTLEEVIDKIIANIHAARRP